VGRRKEKARHDNDLDQATSTVPSFRIGTSEERYGIRQRRRRASFVGLGPSQHSRRRGFSPSRQMKLSRGKTGGRESKRTLKNGCAKAEKALAFGSARRRKKRAFPLNRTTKQSLFVSLSFTLFGVLGANGNYEAASGDRYRGYEREPCLRRASVAGRRQGIIIQGRDAGLSDA